MKIAIIYYSFSGNTKRACVFLKERLGALHHSVDMIDLRPVKEATAFTRQCAEAAFRFTPQLDVCNFDMEIYDMVVVASPVWAFTIAPALKAYLHNVKNISGKKIACFLTYGSGMGAQQALKRLEKTMVKKEGILIFSKKISGTHTERRAFLIEEFKTLIELCQQ